jgi:uroporphyrinogen-III synthase
LSFAEALATRKKHSQNYNICKTQNSEFEAMTNPLKGRKVALAETRQLEELAQLLQQEGAEVLRCPMVAIYDAPDADAVLGWLTDLIAGRFGYVILMTGEALRRLLTFAEKAGKRDAFIQALSKTKLITRGPKPVKALKEIGLQPQIVAPSPTTAGVVAALQQEPLAGHKVGYTLYGSPNPVLADFLRQSGAEGNPVLPYVYAAATDADRVADLIAQMARGEIDLLMITSTPQVERLFEVARERRLQDALTKGLKRTRVAAVGPVAAESLQKHGARVDIQPQQGFVMKNLIQYVKRAFDAANG